MELSKAEKRMARDLGVSESDLAATKAQRVAERTGSDKREQAIANGIGIGGKEYLAEREARRIAAAAKPRAEIAARGTMTAREKHIAHTTGVTEADFIANRDARRPPEPVAPVVVPAARVAPARVAPPSPPPPPPVQRAREQLVAPAPTPRAVAQMPTPRAAPPQADPFAHIGPAPECRHCGEKFFYGFSAMAHQCAKRAAG